MHTYNLTKLVYEFQKNFALYICIVSSKKKTDIYVRIYIRRLFNFCICFVVFYFFNEIKIPRTQRETHLLIRKTAHKRRNVC